MNKRIEKMERPYAEKVLERANIAKRLLKKLNSDNPWRKEGGKGIEIFARIENEGMIIGYENLMNFAIGKTKLLDDKNEDGIGYLTDLNSMTGNGGKIHYQMSELAKYADATFSPKIGKTDLTAREIFELLDECLDIVLKDLKSELPKKNNVVDISHLFNRKLKSSSGTQ